MSSGYGYIRIEGVDGDEESVRLAAQEICRLVAESDSSLGSFEIEIELLSVEGTSEEEA